MANITFSANNNADVYVLPVVPNLGDIEEPQNNEVLKGLNHDIKIIGNPGLDKFSVNSFFPVNKEYTFVANGSEPNGWKYVEFIRNCKKNKVPIRVVITSKSKYTIKNKLFSIEGFKYHPDNVGDVVYQIDLEEFTNE